MLTRPAALERLEAVSSELQILHRELATTLAAEKSAKVHAWAESNEPTLGARERIADFNALDLTLDVITLRGEIAANEAERGYLIEVIAYA